MRNFRGGYKKPQLQDMLIVQIVIFPYTAFLYAKWYARWVWKFKVQKEEFGDEERFYLIRRNLKLSQKQFDVCIRIYQHSVTHIWLHSRAWKTLKRTRTFARNCGSTRSSVRGRRTRTSTNELPWLRALNTKDTGDSWRKAWTRSRFWMTRRVIIYLALFSVIWFSHNLHIMRLLKNKYLLHYRFWYVPYFVAAFNKYFSTPL